jgi:phosphatidylserine decarboxylase
MADPSAPQPSAAHESHLSDAGYRASAAALEHLTNETTSNHSQDPQTTLHRPADASEAHNWLAGHLPKATLERLESRFHLGNFVYDRETGDKSFEAMSVYVRLGMHMLYYGSAQSAALHTHRAKELLAAESLKMGREYDTPESKAHIAPFIASFGLADSMSEMVLPDPNQYNTFNEFFAREIRPDARPIAEPQGPTVVSCPADCRLTTYPTIDLATKFWIKGYGFSIPHLLGDESLARSFDGGSIAIARLAPQDYHRWHAPVSGTVESITEIPGAYYTVNPQAINEDSTLDVFCENRRSVMLVRRDDGLGLVAVIAVGAMLVGSIRYNDGVAVDKHIHRGQCLGAFYYGGSTVIVLFPKDHVVWDDDLLRHSTQDTCETLMRVGWRMGGK